MARLLPARCFMCSSGEDSSPAAAAAAVALVSLVVTVSPQLVRLVP